MKKLAILILSSTINIFSAQQKINGAAKSVRTYAIAEGVTLKCANPWKKNDGLFEIEGLQVEKLHFEQQEHLKRNLYEINFTGVGNWITFWEYQDHISPVLGKNFSLLNKVEYTALFEKVKKLHEYCQKHNIKIGAR